MSSLSITDLKTVYKATFEARDKWQNILLELNHSPASIKAIGARCSNNSAECYREGLTEWLEEGQRSWSELVEALSSPTVGFKDLAEKISREHAVNPVGGAGQGGAYRQPVTGELIIFTKEQLGTGAFGAVFKGRYRDKPCAVKILHHIALQIQTNLPAGQAHDKSVQRFTQECEFLRSFHHPNIVEHLSTEKHPSSGNAILVIELMDCNLRTYFSSLDEEFLNIDGQVSLSRDVAAGLAYIHSKKVIHRDLCGDNILLNLSEPVPVAKISDFGMSRLLDPSKRSSLTLSVIDHRKGYLPPEAARLDEEQYDHSLDVFSLGVVMVQIALKLQTVKSATERVTFVTRIPYTHVLKHLINECLREDMRRRPSASQVYTDLMNYDGTCTRIPRREQTVHSITEVVGHPLGDDVRVTPFKTLYEQLYSARNKWYNLGLALGVDLLVLRDIASKRADNNTCLREMLSSRLETGGPLSWDDLCKGLRSVTVGHNDIADEIERWIQESSSHSRKTGLPHSDGLYAHQTEIARSGSHLDTALKIEDLSQDLKKVMDASPQWFGLGVALGVDSSILSRIRRDNPHHIEQLREMLSARLLTGDSLTWTDLCAALREPTVGRNDVARRIEEEFLSIQTIHPSLTTTEARLGSISERLSQGRKRRLPRTSSVDVPRSKIPRSGSHLDPPLTKRSQPDRNDSEGSSEQPHSKRPKTDTSTAVSPGHPYKSNMACQSTPCIDEVLTSDDLGIVFEKLYPACDKWMNIGLKLGVSHNNLKAVRKNYQDVEDCIKETLAQRLQSGGLTWRMVCDCLRSDTVGRNDIAGGIKQWCTKEGCVCLTGTREAED